MCRFSYFVVVDALYQVDEIPFNPNKLTIFIVKSVAFVKGFHCVYRDDCFFFFFAFYSINSIFIDFQIYPVAFWIKNKIC